MVAAQPASANTFGITSGSWVFNVGGALYCGPTTNTVFCSELGPNNATGSPNLSAAASYVSGDPSSPGTVTFNLAAGQAYNIAGFFNVDLDSGQNDQYTNTTGLGALPAGLSWQVGDLANYGNPQNFNDPTNIVNAVVAGGLGDTDPFGSSTSPGDVSVAFDWNITAANNLYGAVLTFSQEACNGTLNQLGQACAAPAGASIEQLSNNSASSSLSYYFSTQLVENAAPVQNNPTVPEPSTALLLMVGLGVVGGSRLKTRT
jgi:hypothetical protein